MFAIVHANIHEHILECSGHFPRERLLVDCFAPLDMDHSPGHVIYVDNGVFMATTRLLARAAQSKAAQILRDHNLPIHEVTEESDSLDTLHYNIFLDHHLRFYGYFLGHKLSYGSYMLVWLYHHILLHSGL